MHNFINIVKNVSILGGDVKSKHVVQLTLYNCQSLVVTDSYFTLFSGTWNNNLLTNYETYLRP